MEKAIHALRSLASLSGRIERVDVPGAAGVKPGADLLAEAQEGRIVLQPARVPIWEQILALTVDAALALYEARPDKGYSLTDCRSMLALRRSSLHAAAARLMRSLWRSLR